MLFGLLLILSNICNKSCPARPPAAQPFTSVICTRGTKMKLTTFCALTIFAAMAQLKPSEGLNLEVSINAAKDIETDIGRRTPTDLYGRTKAVHPKYTLCEDAMWKQFKKCKRDKCFNKCMWNIKPTSCRESLQDFSPRGKVHPDPDNVNPSC